MWLWALEVLRALCRQQKVSGGVCLDSKSQIHDTPNPKGAADPVPPPLSVLPIFSLHFISHWTLARLLKCFMSMCAREFLVFLYLCTSFPAHLGDCAEASLSQGSEQQQGSSQILSLITQRFTDSLSNAGNKANPHLNLISST